MLKKILFFSALIALLTGCNPKPLVIDGTIKGYDGSLALVSTPEILVMDTINVAEDGTFHLEKVIENPYDGFICVQGSGSMRAIFIPGGKYHFDADMTVKPSVWTYSGDNQDAMDFLSSYGAAYSSFVSPETIGSFKDYSAFWAEKKSEVLEKLAQVKNRKVREVFSDKVEVADSYELLSYAWLKMRKEGIPFESDPDFMAFFNNVDLSKNALCKAMLSSMLNVKADMYSNTIEYSERYLAAIDELSPNLQVRDSVAADYLESIFRDSKISSEENAEFLLAKAKEVGVDDATLQGYKERAEKALALAPGSDAIDFEMIDSKGDVVKLSDFKGKVVYIDFWATWCLPCCMQTPYMAKVATKYKGDNRVACVSVSLDENVDDWLENLANDKPAWPQFRTADAGSAVQNAYGFAAIPRFMLFDREGKIVDIDAPRPQRMDEITGMIDALLK
ncbi:MAG: redoxin family protein [Bacteroidales bacterium]|nr:redoxin family protein [Candidatus Cacconaster merdequi]